MKEVAQRHPGKVRFVSENWGDSKLAERYGIKRYPVVFVNEVLVAKPDDFGWGGEKGRYKPWANPANHEKFRNDLERMIAVAFRDQTELARQFEVKPGAGEISALPNFSAQDLQGKSLTPAMLSGKVVIVEFWATWCPPCRSTLDWLGELKHRYRDKLTVLAISVESEEADVREFGKTIDPAVSLSLGSEALISSFGNITAVPTMYVFDQQGKVVGIFYGATDDLHGKTEGILGSLIK